MKFLIKFFFINYYIRWSAIYRYFEKRKVHNYKDFRQGIFNDFDEIDAIFDKWKVVSDWMKYKKDSPSQLWDAVSDPWCSLMKGHDDCDGYAAIASKVLGKGFMYLDRLYFFDGLYFGFVSGKFSLKKRFPFVNYSGYGHCIAVWKGAVKDDSFVVSTKSLKHYSDVSEAFNEVFGQNLMYAVKCDVPAGIDFKLNFESVLSKKDIGKC